jgi:hypothetical protein
MPSLRSLCAALAIAVLAVPARADWVKFGSGGWGSKWDDPVHPNPATVTWGFMPDGTTIDPGLYLAAEVTGGSDVTQLRNTVDGQYGSGAFDAALARAFDTWHAVAGISFVGPVADSGLPVASPGATTPDIRIGAFAAVPGSNFSYLGAVGFGPPGDDLNFPDPLAGDVMFNLSSLFIVAPGGEGDPILAFGNDLENLFLHELGHAAMGLGHPPAGVGEVMYVGFDCCDAINREPSPDDIAGAQSVYGLSSIPACANGIDDDGDGWTDDAEDPGCTATGIRENPQCQDGVGNDGDGLVDFDGGQSIHGACGGGGCPPGVSDPEGDGVANPDPQCLSAPQRNRESQGGCGLGAEIAAAFLALPRLRRRLERRLAEANRAG